jgi:Holliday junction resolvase RusA-like endonuclease
MIRFTVPGPPAPWHVFTRWDKSPSKARLKAFQEHIRLVAKEAMAGREPYAGPVDLAMVFYRPIPASAPKGAAKRAAWMDRHILTSPDVDNYAKGAQDALNGVVFLDDGQVVSRGVFKRYGEVPRTEFVVVFLKGEI